MLFLAGLKLCQKGKQIESLPGFYDPEATFFKFVGDGGGAGEGWGGIGYKREWNASREGAVTISSCMLLQCAVVLG